MRILWITNTIFPAPSKMLGLSAPVVGGWMYGLAGHLAANSEIKLAVATIYKGNELKILALDNIRHYLLPCHVSSFYQKQLEPLWQKICSEFSPDVVQIHGTEYMHGLACIRACPTLNYAVSIQGLVGICARYYLAGMPKRLIYKNISLRDILRWDTIFHGKKRFSAGGGFEKEYIRRTKHVIGRTGWDYVHTRAMNPQIIYHFCNECLRDAFYSSPKWKREGANKHSIFCSQAGYPIKGLHQLLYAINLLKAEFPDIHVKIAGQDITRYTSLFDKIRISGYGKILRSIIKYNSLEKHVTFVGPLNEESMIQEYLTANVFVCPSSIENSPNSVGEAQILGTPVIATYAGGIPDMVIHGESGLLYRFEEIEMLAENIRKIFTDNSLVTQLSVNGIRAAEKRHDPRENLAETMKIYQEVIR